MRVGKGKKYTHRYAANIVEKLIHSDLTNVAKNNHLTEREVEAMINHVAQQIFPIDLSGLKRLGSLKGCKYILLKRAENLSEKQKIRLIKLK